MKKTLAFLAAATIVLTGTAFATDIVVPMSLIDEQGVGKAVGTVTISEGPSGLVLTPALTDLPPGVHGFHVHQNADCSVGEKDGKKVPGLAGAGITTRPRPPSTKAPQAPATSATCRRSPWAPTARPPNRSARRG